MVKAWECDAFEHFTVAFYYERIADAVLNLFDEVEAGPAHALECRQALTPVATVARFEAELLEGDIHHVESGLVGRDGEIVRTGHKLFNSANGRLAAAFTLAHRYLDLDARKGGPRCPIPFARRSIRGWSNGTVRPTRRAPARGTNRASSIPAATPSSRGRSTCSGT